MTIGRLVAATDFAWHEQRVFGEFDGKMKYGRLLRAGETAGDAVFREKQREDRVRELTGYRCGRLVWTDLARPRSRPPGSAASSVAPPDAAHPSTARCRLHTANCLSPHRARCEERQLDLFTWETGRPAS